MIAVPETRYWGLLDSGGRRDIIQLKSVLRCQKLYSILAIIVSILSRPAHGFTREAEVPRSIDLCPPTSLTRTSTMASTSAFTCLKAWEARSRYWMDEEMKCCSPDELAAQMGVDLPVTKNKDNSVDATTGPKVGKSHVNSRGEIIAVEIHSALTEDEATLLQGLGTSLRNHDFFGPTQFENRSFGPGKGGNDVTYLAPLLQALCPDLASKVVSIVELAYENSTWKTVGGGSGTCDTLPQPSTLGIRTSEHLIYNGWRNLHSHKDIGSVYTVMIALRDPSTYAGGQFFLHTSLLDQTEVKPNRLSAIVFLSNTIHGVRQITDGIRESFVTELWIHDDAPLGMNRPTPEEWEEFLSKNVEL
jgi:hypothetical protein